MRTAEREACGAGGRATGPYESAREDTEARAATSLVVSERPRLERHAMTRLVKHASTRRGSTAGRRAEGCTRATQQDSNKNKNAAPSL